MQGEESGVKPMDTEKLLEGLFDLQRFERDPALQSLILDAEERYFGEELTSGELRMYSAAGDPYSLTPDPKKRDGPL